MCSNFDLQLSISGIWPGHSCSALCHVIWVGLPVTVIRTRIPWLEEVSACKTLCLRAGFASIRNVTLHTAQLEIAHLLEIWLDVYEGMTHYHHRGGLEHAFDRGLPTPRAC
jgi:hypothetical protein